MEASGKLRTDSYGHGLLAGGAMRSSTSRQYKDQSERSAPTGGHNYGLTTKEALVKLHADMDQEVTRMKNEFSKRKLISWLKESISFESELSKMRWPSVLFMTAQAIVHFIVAFILDVNNPATGWVGFQGFILTSLLVFNLSVNLWDTKLRFKELLMKSEQILRLIKQCSQDKHLLRQWKQYNWNSAHAKTLFIPKSPCVHQTLTYRDESCLNLPDYLLVRGDIIHLYPGERAPGECMSIKTINSSGSQPSEGDKIFLKEGEIFHDVNETSKEEEEDGGRDKEAAEVGDDKGQLQSSDGHCTGGVNAYLFSDKRNITMQFSHAKLKKSNKGADFLMLSTPYINSLRISLQLSHKRPVNSVEKECFIITRKYFETFVIPSVFLLSTIFTAIHYGYLDLTDSDQKIKTISIAYLLLRPSLTIMPFLPWMFPCFWLVVNAYGSARIICCGEAQRAKSDDTIGRDNQGYSPGWVQRGAGGANATLGPSKLENLLATPTAAGSSETKHHEDDLHELTSNIKFREIFRVFLDLVRGKSGHVWRSSSLLQVLGCLTSLCCIDKVGILSWSNPTPEKVFVLTNANQNENHESQRFLVPAQRRNSHSGDESGSHEQADESINQQNMMTINSDVLDPRGAKNFMSLLHDDQASSNPPSMQILQQSSFVSQCTPEVLDVSQALNCYRGLSSEDSIQQSRLQFDDLNWRKYITNLKPLGLAILMNNCCEKSFGDYFRFYKHISYESILRCNLTPVVKRRCVCALSRLIGFSRDAIENYKYLNQIGIYKLIDPSSIKKGRLVSSLESSSTRLKLPFPNMICNIHQDVTTGSHQVFSQGTADIILDACVEYWDGKQLVALDESSRKKIMDFYHRTSLTSYCSAFSYTPLLKRHKLGDRYIELPPENSKFAPHLRKLANEHQEEFLQNQLISLPEKHHKSIEVSQTYGSHLSSHDNPLAHSSQSDTSQVTVSQVPSSANISQAPNLRVITRRHLSVEELCQLDDQPKESQTDPIADLENKKEKRGAVRQRSKKSRKLTDALDELTDQVFVGMVAVQYQACPDFVGLVEQLEHACIRFVHFSKENELRSRVFSEKMGLESGWNCHISLQSDQDLDKAERGHASNCTSPSREQQRQRAATDDAEVARMGNFIPTARVSNILSGSLAQRSNSSENDDEDNSTSCEDSISSDERTLYSWRSLPSIVMQLSAKICAEQQNRNSTPDHHQHHSSGRAVKTGGYPSGDFSGDNLPPESDYEADETNGQQTTEAECNESPVPKGEEGFQSLAFDMSNRAKLPKGIENIRPHLETVDNVPLQVSLFTDCTPDLTKEMIEIMQEYGEIVCVIGSSSNRLNTAVFLQANASIAIEPLLPQSCTRNDGRIQRSLERKRRKRMGKKDKRRHRGDKNKPPQTRGLATDGGAEFTAIQMNPPRPNNPRDRLGIGPTEPNKPLRAKLQPSSSSEASSSSSSSTSSSSSSRSSSPASSLRHAHSPSHSDCEFDDDALLEDNQMSEANLNDKCSTSSSMGSSSLARELPGPTSLATKLASLPCSYSYSRKDPVNLYSLIMEARHFTFKMKNTFVCMICFALSVSAAQFLASILFLPPMLSSGLTIWLTVVVVPLMSFSLMNTTIDSQVMKIAVGKNLQLKPENITFFVICYLIKFIPSIIVVVLSFGLIIAHSCKLTGFGSSSVGPCWMFTYVQHGSNATSSDIGDEDLLWSTHLLTAQVCAAFLLVLYFVVISAGFVHRSHLMWERSPTRNHFWVIISLALIIGQLFYNQLVLRINLSSSTIPYDFMASLPLHIWVISFMWPFLVIGINLLVKRAEIKATIRQQRRARFDFNTKLGMNSPF